MKNKGDSRLCFLFILSLFLGVLQGLLGICNQKIVSAGHLSRQTPKKLLF